MSRVMRKATQRPTGAGEATLLVHGLAVFALILFVPVVIISVIPLHNSSSLKEKVLKEKEVSSDVEIGPWGGGEGSGVNPMRFVPDGRISGIHISTGECVDSIRFYYTDHEGLKHHSDRYGGDGGVPSTITFDDDENLVWIGGTVGTYRGLTTITSLSFVTNKKNYGSFGANRGTGFSLPVTKGRIGGFSGRYGAYLESFGVILHPN